MRRQFVFVLLLLALLLPLGIPQYVAQSSRVALLQVFDAQPAPSSPLALSQAITLFFNRRVDCLAAEAAFSWSPAVDGELSCDQFSLTFTPSEDYQRETSYTFDVNPPLQALDGAHLLDSYSVSYLTVGYLQVSEVLPSPEAGPVATDSAITIVFDRPIVPLALSTETDVLPQPLELSPSVAGQGEWINSAIYKFTPASPLKSDSAYIASIDRDLKAVDGAILRSEFSWSFQTSAPSVVSIVPPPATPDLVLDPKIQLRFNQALDQSVVEKAFYLRALPAAGNAEVRGNFAWADDGMGFVFTPDKRLQLESAYEAGFSSELLPDLRFSNVPGSGSWRYDTVSAPAISATEPVDGAQNAVRGGFSLFFASTMNIETLPNRIKIEPEPELPPRFYFSEWSNRYTVSFVAQPSTTYTVRIAPGMEDIFGNAIAKPLFFSFETAPLSPELGLNVPGPVGFYNAYRQPTQQYLYHRGLETIDLALSRVPLSDFVASLTHTQYYDPANDFSPDEDHLLMRWRIESKSPENVTRYELLSLGEDSTPAAEACPGAPESRLRGGDVARVVTTPDPLRARQSPPDGEIMQLLYHGYEMTVAEGPHCIDGVRWWQATLDDGRAAWVAEGLGEEYFIEPAAEEDAGAAQLPDDGLQPGVYFLEAQSPELDDRIAWQSKHFLNVATAVLTVKQATDRLTIWAVDVRSGAAIDGESVAVYGPGGDLAGSGITDENGLVQVDIPYDRDLYSPYVALLSTPGHFGIGHTSWSNGTEPWQFGYDFSWSPRAYQTYLYTDRPVYRSGQPIYFRGIVRRKDDVVYMPAPHETAPITIRDAQGEIVYERDLALSDFGTFDDRFEIAPDASLGVYSLSLSLPTEDEFVQEGGGITFLVAEYRLPEYQVSLSTEQPEIAQGAAAAFELEGRYFFGGPVSNAAAEYVVYSTPYAFDYIGEGRYDFVDFSIYETGGEAFDLGRVISEGSLTTDEDGNAGFDLVGDLTGEARSQRWRVEASIRDEADQTIYGSSSLVVHQGLIYVGARAENAVSRAGEDNRINLIAVDWDSRPIADQHLDVEVVERRWTSVQEQDPTTGATAWTWDVEEIPVTSGSVTTGANGKASFVYEPTNGGIFKIVVFARDSAGNQVRAATYSWVSSPDYVSWRQENTNALQLVPDKLALNIGESAKILIASPFQGPSEALISIERGDVLSAERITLTSNSHIYEFEILPRHAPNIYVNVFLVKPAVEEKATAAWRLGMTQLLVDIEQKALSIDISADRDIAAPQEDVEYRLRVTDFQGDPVVAELGIGVTDLAALSVAERNSDGLLEAFYGPQALSVRTSSSLVVNADAVTAKLSAQKGGGGGLFEAGVLDLRGEFVDTAYWNASVLTDIAGQATVNVRLPDNLTTWRLDARALTEGRDGRLLVGEETFDLLSTRPLLIRPVTPRFFVVGDKAQLSAVVNNNTGNDIAASVSIENTAGLALAAGSDLVHEVMIPADGRQRVSWQATVADVDSVAPYFVVRSADDAFSDASISPVSADSDGALPVYRYQVPETAGTAGMLREAGSRVEAVLLPRDIDVNAGNLSIRIDKSLAGVTNESLNFMEAETTRFRECASTIVSRFLPNIVAYRALNELNLAQAALKTKLDELVSEGLQTLYARQLANGGWSWCSYTEADELTTAYALIGLAEAQQQAYPVDENVIRRAQRFLSQRLITPSLNIEPWRLNRQAFVLYALARSGAPDVARSATLFESHERMNLDAIAYLAQAVHLINPDDRLRLDTLTQVMVNRAVTRASGIFFEETYEDRLNWSSDIRSTALVLNALVKLRPESDLLPNIVRHLVSAREGRGHWQSRQENTWSLIALTNWMLVSGELEPDYIYSVAVNGVEKLRDVALPQNAQSSDELSVDLTDLMQRDSNIVEIERGQGDGALYYTAHLKLDLPVHQVKSLSRGIEISRSYTLLDDESRSEIIGAAVGDVVQVRLRITAPNTLRYVVIEDFFPAGAEAINPDLTISPQLGALPGGALVDPREQGWGWWFFDQVEFRDEKAVIYANTLPAGVYEYVYTIRPSIAGEYKVIPPAAQELYFPEVNGRGSGSLFTVSD